MHYYSHPRRCTLETREGELVEYSESPAWAGGINALRAAGPELKALIAKAATREQLAEIAKARGYDHRWVFHILKSRSGREAA